MKICNTIAQQFACMNKKTGYIILLFRTVQQFGTDSLQIRSEVGPANLQPCKASECQAIDQRLGHT
jgi:hypothetical protein